MGKEYAVDKCIQLLKANSIVPALVNLGGDLAVTAQPIMIKLVNWYIDPRGGAIYHGSIIT